MVEKKKHCREETLESWRVLERLEELYAENIENRTEDTSRGHQNKRWQPMPWHVVIQLYTAI